MASTTWHLTAADGTALGRLDLVEGGDTIREFLLHVDGSKARLRY